MLFRSSTQYVPDASHIASLTGASRHLEIVTRMWRRFNPKERKNNLCPILHPETLQVMLLLRHHGADAETIGAWGRKRQRDTAVWFASRSRQFVVAYCGPFSSKVLKQEGRHSAPPGGTESHLDVVEQGARCECHCTHWKPSCRASCGGSLKVATQW